MRHTLSSTVRVALFGCLLAASLFAQDFKPANSGNAKQFLGKWQSSFHGKVFLTLTLTADAQKMSGTVSGADIELNDAGELTKAEPSEGMNSITDARVNGNRLRITAKSNDGSEESIQSEIVLTGSNEAELRMIVPADVPNPKPWKLTRVH